LDRQTVGIGEAMVADATGWRAATGVPLDYNSPAARLVWLEQMRPDAYRRARWFLSPKDFINFKLTGAVGCDPTMASKTALVLLATGTWDAPRVRALRIDPGRLPPIVESAATIGAVTSNAAQSTTLPAETPVITGCGDDYSQALGAGAVEPGELNIGTGTGSAWKGIVDRPVVAPSPELETHRFVWPGRWVLWTGIHGTGYSARWLAELLRIAGDERAELDAWVAAAEPGSEGLVFYPHLWGSRLPRTNPRASAVFFGAGHQHRRGHFYQAVLEGAALLAIEAWRVYAAAGFAPTRVTISGGEAANSVWNQMKADALGVPIHVMDPAGGTPADASAFGAALLAGIGIGFYSSPAAAARATLPEGQTFTPRSDCTQAYRALFERYMKIYTQIEAAYAVDSRPSGAVTARRREPA
jgi:xylulokinase